ncbi:hypothetical protein G3480_21195 [Thiorhodococcus mannitoliphagus]|uniref:histidine kinase n=1 Tax=Thiorhodococcus mannitoliphagus TaxID=329406 RepID=A0A6P1DWU8_9GAMM|nr:7TM diverse intracellular signaling domain-containing protein [Thiorhodococcus mannitoliphagus]NEX22787.1 hypothetical protein [Thiorhodococcus mannitoliphagus]
MTLPWRTFTLILCVLTGFAMILALVHTRTEAPTAASLSEPLSDIQTPSPWRPHELAVLVDPDGTETLDRVTQPERAEDFVPRPRGFSAGYTRDVHWLRFRLYPPPLDTQGQRHLLLTIQPPFLDDLRLYLPRQPDAPPDGFALREGGDRLAFAAREYPYRAFAYEVIFPDDQPLTLYLRLQTTSSSWVSLAVMPAHQLAGQATGETLLLALTFGLLLAGILANLWHGLWIRQPLYRAFLFYLLAFLLILFASNGFLAQFVLPDAPDWNNRLTSLFNVLFQASLVYFYKQALDIGNASRWMRWVYSAILGLTLLAIPPSLLGWYPEAMRVLGLFILLIQVLGTLRSLQLWWRGTGENALLFLAHLFTLTGLLITASMQMGLLPGKVLLLHAFQIGVLGSLVALQILLSQRVRTMERTQMNSSLAAERASAEARMTAGLLEQQRHFMRMLVHEIKTPLAVMRLRLDAQAPSERMQALAREAIADIDAIIQRCALSARLEDQALEEQPEICDFPALLRRYIATQPEPERFEVNASLAPEARQLHADPILLGAILSNLLDNAAKYAPPKSAIALELQSQSRNNRPGIGLSIANLLPPHHRPDLRRVFEKYYRAPGARRRSGSGLGLHIVHQLVEQLSGDIRCHDQDQNRLEFQLWLPTNPT